MLMYTTPHTIPAPSHSCTPKYDKMASSITPVYPISSVNDSSARNTPGQRWFNIRQIASGPSSSVWLHTNSVSDLRVMKVLHRASNTETTLHQARLHAEHSVSNAFISFVICGANPVDRTQHPDLFPSDDDCGDPMAILRKFVPHRELRNSMKCADVAPNAAGIM